MLDLWIHELTIRFLVPPGITEIGIHKEVALVHVTVHALARRNRAGELMHDRMTRFVLWDGRIGGKTQAVMPILTPPARVRGRSIIRVNHVTSRASTRAIVTRMIVRTHEAKQRIMQSGLLDAEKDR